MPPKPSPTGLRHSAHDLGLLLRRWEKVVRSAKLSGVPLSEAGSLPVWGLETAAAAKGEAAVYLSAGVHGDEPAGAWALLEWAEQQVAVLRTGAFLLVPCFNPEGFISNTRTTGQGVDMNRYFDDETAPLMIAWRAWVTSRKLALAACLHEDYDALGCYVYELSGRRACVSERLLRTCAKLMKRDPRSDIDGSAARRGIIHRRRLPRHVKGPEAIVLRTLGCPLTLTFETASECDITTRVATHQAFLQEAVTLVLP
jgi:murein peptide amidase A